MECAAELFAEKGFRRATMDDLADVVGIAKPTLYVYGKSKVDILERIFVHIYDRALAALAQAQAQPTAQEAFSLLVGSWTTLVAETPAMWRVFFFEMDELRSVARGRVNRQESEAFRQIRELVQRGQTRGEFKPELDPTVVTFAVLGIFNWTATWYRPDRRLDVDQIVKGYDNLLAGGLFVEVAKPG
jgi:AcrR family transcriptional regulator